ncbi:MAG: DUF2931 family protein [Ewingella sp.]|uniref:DUF2931 family protein n=1 Tax=Ewingella TaxID=41201 RepID=UPI0017AB2B1E|nr:DUF2931 family protein [Pseudomonas reactans]
MEITRLAASLLALTLVGCQATAGNTRPDASNPFSLPYGEWRFSFVTPKALPSLVTFASILDTDDIVYQFNTLDGTQDNPDSVGKWSQHIRRSSVTWNKAKHPPKAMVFCWDSVIDMKVYETSISFPQSVWEKMITPADHKNRRGTEVYYDTMIIGLAPEGKVTVWLQDVGNYPNYRVTPSSIKTLSGEQLDICKGITKHPNGYKYYGETPDFIKGKTYPYGNW